MAWDPAYIRQRRVDLKLQCQQYLADRDTNGVITCVCGCGRTRNLDHSHNNPITKSFEICDAINQLKDFETVIRPELDKCSLRARRCHLIYDGKLPEPKHGTREMYQNYGCRCDSCKDAHNQWMREYQREHQLDYLARKKLAKSIH